MTNQKNKAKAYARERYTIIFANMAVAFVFLLGYQIFLSGFFKELAFNVNGNFYIAVCIYAFFFYLIRYVANFPTSFYGSYILEHKFSLSNQNLKDWIKDELKSKAISVMIFLLLVSVFYLLLMRSGRFWWVYLAFVWLFFTIVFTRIMPTLIIPLFYKYKPIENDSLKNRIREIAAKSAIKLMDIFQIDFSRKTKKANAAVVGIGKSRRVLLTDTLLANFSEDEIISVCAHEFAHHKFYHMLKMIMFSGVLTATGFYILDLLINRIAVSLHASSIHDIYIFPSFLLVLSIFGLIVTPFQNAYSRILEKQADNFAIDVTGSAKSFKSVMERLAELNLADTEPPKLIKYLFYDHPPISERIKMADEKLAAL